MYTKQSVVALVCLLGLWPALISFGGVSFSLFRSNEPEGTPFSFSWRAPLPSMRDLGSVAVVSSIRSSMNGRLTHMTDDDLKARMAVEGPTQNQPKYVDRGSPMCQPQADKASVKPKLPGGMPGWI